MKPLSNRKIPITLSVIFCLLIIVTPNPVHAEGVISTILGGAFDLVGTVLAPLVYVLIKIVSLITMISGVLLNAIIYETVVQMANNFSNVPAIDSTWSIVRDVANMGFIFVLLYAAIKTIIGQGSDNKSLIVRVVIAAVLVNFSLFFTKLVIDAANIIALLFYGSIAPGATADGINGGIANSFMDIMRLQTLFNAQGTINPSSIATVGILGSLVLLISAFSFLAVAVMFVIRYVVLIFTLILSPLAFVAGIMPGLDSYRTKWWNALSGQAFFAPIYFFLVWVSLSVLQGFVDSQTFGTGSWATAFSGTVVSEGGQDVIKYGAGEIQLIIQFAIVISFMIAALIVAKSWADKAGPQVKNLTKWATGAAGNVAFGASGWAGRASIGRLGQLATDNASLQEVANKKTGIAGASARLALYAGRKARSGSFDARRASVPTGVIGDAIQGTVGRTEFGKKLGLDDVNIPVVGSGENLKIGGFAAGATGVGTGREGGYKERKAESEKRVDEREKATAEEYRKVESKAKIKAGLSSGASTDAIREMQETIKDMSNKEVLALDANTLAEEKVAEALTASHLKAINEDKDNFSENDKREIFEKHFKEVGEATDRITAAIAAGNPPDSKDTNVLKNISDKEMSYVPRSMFDPSQLTSATPIGNKSKAFLGSLGQKQIDEMLKGDKYINPEKQLIKDEKARPLKEAFATGLWTGRGGAIPTMEKMGEAALAKMDAKYDPADPTTHNIPSLNNPNILEMYNPSTLNKLATKDEFNPPKRRAVREAIINTVSSNPRMTKALDLLSRQKKGRALGFKDRQRILRTLTPKEKNLVLSTEWLEGEFGRSIF